MMAHVAPGEYAIHGREAPSYNAATEFYGGNYLPPHMQGDPVAFHRPQNQLSEDASVLADALAGIDIAQSARGKPAPSPNKELVVHAIEAAASVLRDQASALRDQISENERLRSALRVREWELQNYQGIDQGPSHPENPSQDDFHPNSQPLGPTTFERSSLSQGPNLWAGNGFSGDPQSSLIVHPNMQSITEKFYRYSSNGAPSQQYGLNFGANGALRPRNIPEGAFSHTSSPTARSTSPIRLGREGESGGRSQPGAVGNNQPRQDLVKSSLRPQDEIIQLKNLLSDCTIKEMQLVHENQMLEKRVSDLGLTIENYQQKLVERESLIRHDILAENARLSSELRAAIQDINFYSSSLMPLLAEFNLQPASRDPHSIVSGIKALVQHLGEEGRKDSLPPNQPWRSPQMYPSSQSGVSSLPAHQMSWAPKSPEPHHGLEIVPQASYLHPERPLSPTSPLSQNPNDWDMAGAPNPHHPFSTDNYANDNARRSAYLGQTAEPQHMSSRGIPDYGRQRNDSYNDADEEATVTGLSHAPEYSERTERLSPQLPTVREDPPSSLSDEEDPLPDIEGLCINGDANLGSKITACGISINGTTLCHFQWVRHHQDGSYFHIPGAAQPEYTITADDVDTLLSLECTPMDDRNRKGEMVQVFVNNHNRIPLEPDMKDQIIEYLDNGQAIFDVKLVGETLQESTLEPAVLTLKRSMYELKRMNGRRIVGNEKYASESAVEIKVGKDCQCAIINNTGVMHLLGCNDNRSRDLLVLTMREFIKAAFERKRGGKKRLWMK
eukprot:c19590_g1_i2 orf=161-2509(+)